MARRRLLDIVTEDCATCAQHSSPVGQNSALSNTTTNDMLIGDRDRRKDRSRSCSEFTYDRGEGVKKNVVVTGPLSEVFTKALNTYFSKEPLGDPEDKEVEKPDIEEPPKDTADKIEDSEEIASVGEDGEVTLESQQQDAAVIEGIVKTLHETHEPSEEDVRINVVDTTLSANMDPTSTVTYIVKAGEATRPEVVDHVQKLAEVNKDRFVLLVYDTANGITHGTGVKRRLLDVNKMKKETTDDLGRKKLRLDFSFSDLEQLPLAMEALYEDNGIKVAYGLGGLMSVLKEA